jgi:cell division protein FtsA
VNVRTDNLITVLDAGSAKICVLVAELTDGVLRYRGHGVETSRGMRRGVIADLRPGDGRDQRGGAGGGEVRQGAD